VCCEGCIPDHNQAVPHSVCAERSDVLNGQDYNLWEKGEEVVNKMD
jgi:hypothetical protein